MIPACSPTRPILIIENEDSMEEEEDFLASSTAIFSRIVPIPMTALTNFATPDEQIPNEQENPFRLRLTVDGFQPHELNISIRHGGLIVRGKHIVRTSTSSSSPPSFTTNSIPNINEDTEPDFVAKEFKRTFSIPSNTDIRKAHARFYPQQQLLIIEIPFQTPTDSSSTRINRIRPMDIFLAMIMILSMDRAIRLTYEQFLINEQHSINPTASQHRNRRRRDIL